MGFLTDRKRATGLGASHTGTEHHWQTQVSAVALAILLPLFIFTFGSILGAPYGQVIAYFGRPFPAIVTALTLVVGMIHFKNGARMFIEDYVQGGARAALIIAVTCLAYAIIATGLFALIRLAL